MLSRHEPLEPHCNRDGIFLSVLPHLTSVTSCGSIFVLHYLTRDLLREELLNGLLAELPTILDSFFIVYTNTTSTHIRRGGGWGVMGSHEVVG